MNQLLENFKNNKQLIVAVATAAALGTLAAVKMFSNKKSSQKREYPAGSGPTGNGKWKLYHTHSFRSARCVYLIAEMKAMDDFEIVEYNPYLVAPEERSHFKRHLHPHNKIPAMVTHKGNVMIESGAICMYLAQLYGKFLPDKQSELDYYNWIVHAVVAEDTVIRPLYRDIYVNKSKDKDPELVEVLSHKCLEWVSNLERFFVEKSRPYICENGFTAADVVVGYSVFWLSIINGGMLLSDSPHVEQYLARLKQRPLWEKYIGTDSEWLNVQQSYDLTERT